MLLGEKMELKDLGETIDALYSLRQVRLQKQKEIDEMKAKEMEFRQIIIGMLETAGLAKASGFAATAGIKTTVEPLVTDWDPVFDYIRKENKFELIQKRISAPAWRELKESGILVPGTEPNEVVDISLTKSTRG
jgi:hypothetical protein